MKYQRNYPAHNPALEKAKLRIADAFRPERAAKQDVILNGHRVQALVEAGRYGMIEACQLMKVSHSDVSESLKWLIDDNARMNATYDTDIHCCAPGDYIMVGWFAEQDGEATTAAVGDKSAKSKAHRPAWLNGRQAMWA